MRGAVVEGAGGSIGGSFLLELSGGTKSS